MKRLLGIRHIFLLFLPVMMIMCFFVPVSAEETEEEIPDNGIPVVYINVDESQGTIEDMIGSGDHSVYCFGTVCSSGR